MPVKVFPSLAIYLLISPLLSSSVSVASSASAAIPPLPLSSAPLASFSPALTPPFGEYRFWFFLVFLRGFNIFLLICYAIYGTTFKRKALPHKNIH